MTTLTWRPDRGRTARRTLTTALLLGALTLVPVAPAGASTADPSEAMTSVPATGLPGDGSSTAVTDADETDTAHAHASTEAQPTSAPQVLPAEPLAAEEPDPPAMTWVVQADVHGFTVAWSTPINGPRPTGYHVTVWAPGETNPFVDVRVSDQRVVVTGLLEGTTYAVDVRSVVGTQESAATRMDVSTRVETFPPVGNLESATKIPGGGGYRIDGWAVDVDTAGPIHVLLKLDFNATLIADVYADGNRPDVGAAYPGTGDQHGFSYTWAGATSANIVGLHRLCLWAEDVDTSGYRRQSRLDCTTISFEPTQPLVGNFEALTRSGPAMTLSGWALEPSGGADVLAVVEIDGELESLHPYQPTDVVRSDVAAAYPGTGAQHGFSSTVKVGPGGHRVCVGAVRKSDLEETVAPLGCRTVGADPTIPIGNFESLVAVGQNLQLSGWAVDPQVAGPVDVDVHLDGALVATMTTTTTRADVGRVYPGTGNLHGYSGSVQATPGSHQVCLTTPDPDYPEGISLGCRTVSVVNRTPVGNYESLTAAGSTVTLSGWALDPDTTGPIDVHLYVDGGWGGALRTTGVRNDVAAAYPGTGNQHGFSTSFTAGTGTHQVCAYAIDPAIPTVNQPLGCRTVTVTNKLPLGNLEALTAAGSTLTFSGWALDPDTTGPIDVHLYVDGGWGGALRTTGVRNDVAAAYPGTGNQHGFSTSFTAGTGTHQVCAYAIDPAIPTVNQPLGCRTVTVTNKLPLGNLEALTAAGSTLTFSGWALDPDTTGPIDVHLYVDGGWGGALRTTGVRNDVAAAYPGTGNQHGFSTSFTAGTGTHQVCAYAIDSTTPTMNQPLGCRTVAVR
ncbi:fibronectin type III domain-containing protein [Cellulomonas sp. URHB0016]